MEWFIFFLTFGILFLGELGDKTQLIVFNISLEHQKAYKVAIGATVGFALIVTIGVIFGMVIANFIPLSIIALISSIIFIVIGLLEGRSLKKLYFERKELNLNKNLTDHEPIREENTNNTLTSKFSKLRKNPYIAGFSFIFLMELGDKTQILTITLASIYPYPFEVWLGSFLALVSLAWIGVFFGAIIAQKLSKFYLKLMSTIIFIFIGILILITSF